MVERDWALETLFAAQTALKELGFSDIEVTQLAATRGKPVGAYTMLTGEQSGVYSVREGRK